MCRCIGTWQPGGPYKAKDMVATSDDGGGAKASTTNAAMGGGVKRKRDVKKERCN